MEKTKSVNTNPAQVKSSSFKFFLFIGIIGLLILGTIEYSFYNGKRMVTVYAPNVDAAMEIKVEATTAHLWLEEILSGDRNEDLGNVYDHVDLAEWYVNAMLEGGQNSEGIFIPLKDIQIRKQLKDVEKKLAMFRIVTDQRLDQIETSGIGSVIDQSFDDLYEDLVIQIDEVESRLQELMAKDLLNFRIIEMFVLVLTVSLFLIIGIMYVRFERRRTKDEELVKDANKNLIEEVNTREQAEISLRDKEEDLRITVNSIGDGVIATDTNGCVTRLNGVAEELTGWVIEDALGKPLNEIFRIMNSKTRMIIDNPVAKVLETGKVIGLANHTLLISKLGIEYHIADSAAPIKDDNGNTLGVVLVFRNVTEEYKIKEELRKSEANYHFITENSLDTIWSTDRDLKMNFVNKAIFDLLGYTQEEILKLHPTEYTPIKSFKKIKNANEILLSKFEKGKLEQEQIDIQQIKKDGSIIDVELTCNILSNENKEFIGFQGRFLDITQKKKSEKEIDKLQKYLSNIVDSMPSVLIGVDTNLNITQWNKQAANTSGRSIESVLGSQLRDVLYNNVKTIEIIIEMVQEAISKKETIQRNTEEKRNAKIFHESITIFPIFLEENSGAVIRIDNVSDQVELQQRLNQSQKMDAIGQLSGGVAHDFNNMLAGIIGAAQILKSPKQNLNEKGLKFVEMIIEASTRAAELTAKLLAFGRKGNVDSTSIDMHTVIDDTLAIFNRTIDKKIKISVKKNANNSYVIGDNSTLQNSLINIGINASHAMKKDGGMLSIETRNISLNENYCESSQFDLKPGEFIEIEIRDNGIGISAENVKKIFEPFFTTKKQGEGSGLGLASVFGTITNHRGAINVYSELGTGTVFHIYIPCTYEIEKKEKVSEVILSGVGQILLVDDEDLILVTGQYTLSEMGYDVIVAENGLEALEIYKEKSSEIDLVIMDMIMPEMNGREAFYKMKEIDPNCKVIISSGFTKDENLKELKEDGLLGFIQKPFRDYELSKLLAKIIVPVDE